MMGDAISLSPVEYDVVVIGAGPAGSCAAAALAARGWRVMLVERDRFPRHKVCGEFLSPEAQDSLRTLELYDELAGSAPVPLVEARLTAANGVAMRLSLPAKAWGLSRYAMDAALAQAAVQRGATLRQECTALGLEREQQTDRTVYTVTLRRRSVKEYGARAHGHSSDRAHHFPQTGGATGRDTHGEVERRYQGPLSAVSGCPGVSNSISLTAAMWASIQSKRVP